MLWFAHRVLLATLAIPAVGGCVRPTPGPTATLANLTDALERNDRVAVEALSTPRPADPTEGRPADGEPAEAPAPAPERRVEDELRVLARALRAASVQGRATVIIPSAEGASRSVLLVEEDGAFRIDAGVLGLPALDTPERAIASLHRALAREISLGPGTLLAGAERRSWLEERARYRDGTADPESLDVRVDGDQARATTPLGDEIVLVREGPEWRVVSMRALGIE